MSRKQKPESLSIFLVSKDKKYLAKTYGKNLGKASVTGYCIRFKTLKDLNIDTLEAAIRYGLAAQNEKRQKADEIIPPLKASSYRCKGAPVYDPYSPDPRHKAILYKNGSPAIVVRLSVSVPCLSLFAVAHCGSITDYPEVMSGHHLSATLARSRFVAEVSQVRYWKRACVNFPGPTSG